MNIEPLFELINEYTVQILEIKKTEIILELSGTKEKIQCFTNLLAPFRIIEYSQSKEVKIGN